MAAAGKVLSYLKENPHPEQLIAAARRLVFLKGRTRTITSSARPSWKIIPTYLLRGATAISRASVFHLRGSGGPDNDLVKRTRAALQA